MAARLIKRHEKYRSPPGPVGGFAMKDMCRFMRRYRARLTALIGVPLFLLLMRRQRAS